MGLKQETQNLTVALVGDYNASVTAHQAIPLALELAGMALGVTVEAQWTPTETLDDDAAFAENGVIGSAAGIWCVPASPYQSTEGALRAIRFARENGIPFLGTCGGFQHAVLEFAQNVLGWADATHAEMDPSTGRAVITALSCSLVEARGAVRFVPGSRIAAAYNALNSEEGYHCRYGMEESVRAALVDHGMEIVATDTNGEVRAIELPNHPFFVASLFQPERAALKGILPPLVRAFVAACDNSSSG